MMTYLLSMRKQMNNIEINSLNQFKPSKTSIEADLYFLGSSEHSRTQELKLKILFNNENNVYYFRQDNPDFFEEILLNKMLESKRLTLFIDSSCLPRKSIANIFKIIGESIIYNGCHIELFISYTVSKFKKPENQDNTINKSFAPIVPFFAGWSANPELPVEVIVSLGYEEAKAAGAVEYLEPATKWVFVPNSPITNFLTEVEKHNKNLLDNSIKERINYQVLDPIETYHKLSSLILSSLPFSKIVILPFGPKIFFPISLLIALQLREIAIWHVDTDSDDAGMSIDASEHSVIFSCKMNPTPVQEQNI